MNEELKKMGYSAPKLKVISFKIEQGYATSGFTEKFTDVSISFGM